MSTGAFCTTFQWVAPPTSGRYHGEPRPRRWVAVPLAEVPNTETPVLLANEMKSSPEGTTNRADGRDLI